MSGVEIIKARNTLSPRARTNLAKRLRVAAYCRVSTDSEDQLNSYKSQPLSPSGEPPPDPSKRGT